MGIQTRRRVIDIGGSRYVAVPSVLKIGNEASIAGNRLLLIDPRGEIDATLLLDFMEKYIEPLFWQWLATAKAENVVVVDDPRRVPLGAHLGAPLRLSNGEKKARDLEQKEVSKHGDE